MQRAGAVQDGRIESVRVRAKGRQGRADLREQVAEAEREDVRRYGAALSAGWTPEELHKIGYTEPDKVARVRRRATSPRTSSAAADGQQSGT